MAGKGSRPRPVNKKKYDTNWSQINWKSKKNNKEKNANRAHI